MKKSRIKYLVIAVVLCHVLLGCSRIKHIPLISKVCLVTHNWNSTIPDIAIEVDSSLNYKFFGGEKAIKKGLMQGKISKDLWDTIQIKFTHLQYWITKEQSLERNIGPKVTCSPPPPFTMSTLIHYEGKVKQLNTEGNDSIANVLLWLLNTYKTVNLKALPPDEKLTFELELPIINTHHSSLSDTNRVDTGQVYSIVSQLPVFIKDSLNNYLAENINYPKKAQDKGIETTIFAAFIIEKNGSISNAQILRNPTGINDFNKEVLRVLNTMPKWNPGKNNGIPVRVQFIIPIHFKLK